MFSYAAVPVRFSGQVSVRLDYVLFSFGIVESDGSLEMYFEPEEAGHALHTFLQALKKLTDLNYLKREY